MCLILHIESSTKVCSVAISRNGNVISLVESQDDNYAHGEQLTLFIERALEEANISINDLNAVSVTSGPGSYTGLRIGVSTAKGLCYALGLPLISVNSLLNLAMLANEFYPNSSICSMIDARRMEVFSGIYNAELIPIKEISADILDEMSYVEFEPFVCVGDGASKMESLWKNRNISFDERVFSSAKGHAKYAYDCFLNKQFEDVAYFEPYYLKDFVFNSGKQIG